MVAIALGTGIACHGEPRRLEGTPPAAQSSADSRSPVSDQANRTRRGRSPTIWVAISSASAGSGLFTEPERYHARGENTLGRIRRWAET